MSVTDELIAKRQNKGIWHIGGKNAELNPYIGSLVEVTWLKPWGGKKAGFTAIGVLKATFAKYGHTLIGEIEIQGPNGKKALSCPWSRNYLSVRIL